MALPSYAATNHNPTTFRLAHSPAPGTLMRIPGHHDVLTWNPDLYPALESIEALREHGDEPADAVLPVLLKIRKARGQASMDLVQVLLDALRAIDSGDHTVIDGVDLDQDEVRAVKDMWNEVGSVPDWVDFTAIERGQSSSMQHAPLVDSILGMSSLAGIYSVQPNNSILLTTGYLFAENINKVRRRLLETGHMVYCTSTGGRATFTPGSGIGWTSVLNVRFLHAMVRYRLMKKVATQGNLGSTSYDFEKNRVPINQPDMLITALTFSTNVTRGLKTLGFAVGAEDEQAYLHLWALITHLLGVRLDLNPLAPEHVVRAATHQLATTKGDRLAGSLGLPRVHDTVTRGGFAYRVQDALMLALYCPDADVNGGNITHTFVHRLLDAAADRFPVYTPRYQLVAFAHRFWDKEYAAKLGFPATSFWASVDLWVHLNVVVRVMISAWRWKWLQKRLLPMYQRMHALAFAHYVLGMPVGTTQQDDACVEAAQRAMARFGFHGMQPDAEDQASAASGTKEAGLGFGFGVYLWVAVVLALAYFMSSLRVTSI